MGDTEGGEDYIQALADCPSHIIAGNNDFFTDLSREKEFVLEGKRIFIVHGHQYLVSIGEERIKREARNRNVDIVMYGHTHVPSHSEEAGLLILNPGSIAYPRQSGRQSSYIVMELRQGEPVVWELKYV